MMTFNFALNIIFVKYKKNLKIVEQLLLLFFLLDYYFNFGKLLLLLENYMIRILFY